MPEKPAVTYANFPERELKVVIGANINAASTKTLRRMSIGTYEMSFVQQERGKNTADAARTAMNHLAKALGLTVTPETHRDFVYTVSAANAEHKFQLWVTTPFELTQSAHIIWTKYVELGGEAKVGVAFKLSTGFTFEDVEVVLKAAQKNAVVLPEGEPFTLKGNPPPRFAKKAVAAPAAEAAPADAAAAEEKPAEG
ncbi:MAG TPA: hypothetical protein VHX44_19765 [Planctomycetota bacterium]|nr:hypothetical protein [Planctomycetota bacterium]